MPSFLDLGKDELLVFLLCRAGVVCSLKFSLIHLRFFLHLGLSGAVPFVLGFSSPPRPSTQPLFLRLGMFFPRSESLAGDATEPLLPSLSSVRLAAIDGSFARLQLGRLSDVPSVRGPSTAEPPLSKDPCRSPKNGLLRIRDLSDPVHRSKVRRRLNCAQPQSDFPCYHSELLLAPGSSTVETLRGLRSTSLVSFFLLLVCHISQEFFFPLRLLSREVPPPHFPCFTWTPGRCGLSF